MLGRVYKPVSDVLSYDTIQKVIPLAVQQNVVVTHVIKFFLALFNQRDIITLPLNFLMNFSPVLLWLMFFKNAGFLSTEWREKHIPINNGITRDWDAKYFAIDIYGITFFLFHIFLVLAWIKITHMITTWMNQNSRPVLSKMKEMYTYYRKTTTTARDDIETGAVEPEQEEHPEYYLDVKRGVVRNQLHHNSPTSAFESFDTDIELLDVAVASNNSSNNNQNIEANNRNLNAMLDSDIEDFSFPDPINNNPGFDDDLNAAPTRQQQNTTLVSSDSGPAHNLNDIMYNPNISKTRHVTTTKSLKEVFLHLVPWAYKSNVSQINGLLFIALFSLLTWVILNVDQSFYRPITPAKDVMAFLLYVAGHATAPIATAVYLYIFHPAGVCAGFSFTLALQNIAGVWTHLFWPSTPPWFHTLHPPGTIPTYQTIGRSAGLQRILESWGKVQNGFNTNKIVFGALPSLHSAIAFQTLIFVLYYSRNKFARALVIAYVSAQWWATIYLDHHWRLDLIVGMWYSLAAFAIMLPYLLYIEGRYKKTRYIDCDATSPHFRTFGMRLFQNSAYEHIFDPYYNVEVSKVEEDEEEMGDIDNYEDNEQDNANSLETSRD